MKEYFGVRHVFLVSSGKAALTLILLALKSISRKNEVMIPAYACFSLPSSIAKAGLKISLCDINPSTLDLNRQSLEKRLTENTLCVVPNHLFGAPAEMETLLHICRQRGVFVIEDAAQAMGNTYNGRKLGTFGDAGFFSLGRGKNITCGSGGVIVTESDKIAGIIMQYYSKLKSPGFFTALYEWFQLLLMTIFIRPSLYWFPDGLSFLKLGETFFHKTFPITRLSGMKASYLHDWKINLEKSNHVRSNNVSYYKDHLRLASTRNPNTPYLRLPIILKNAQERDHLYLRSRQLGLGASLVYPSTINKIKEIRQMFNGEIHPCADDITNRILTIPTHHLLSEKDKETICALINSVNNHDPAHASNNHATHHVTVT